MSIYVETFIMGTVDGVWEKTQNPKLHERWDLRFTKINYLPKDDTQPQRFEYKTHMGFGLEIAGMGETVGERFDSDRRTSALKFWSDDPKSLIREGSGYWKYEQAETGVRFLTRYDYDTRFVPVGKVFDRIVFRPLLGWATAWSFDRLRLWVEKGIDPAVSFQRSLIHAAARLTLAFIWIYQGVVPKLPSPHHDELAMVAAAGVPLEIVTQVVQITGVVEVIFALVLLLTWNRRRILLLNVPLMSFAAVGVALTSPADLAAPFNPVTLNTAVLVLALIGYWISTDLPSASRCLRKEKTP